MPPVNRPVKTRPEKPVRPAKTPNPRKQERMTDKQQRIANRPVRNPKKAF